MKLYVIAIAFSVLMPSVLYASQSIITEAEGLSCTGNNMPREDALHIAYRDAARMATENAVTYIKRVININDWDVKAGLVNAYGNAKIKFVQELEKGWLRDQSKGDCFKIRYKVEVIPDQQIVAMPAGISITDDPASPLDVKLWIDRKEYHPGQKMKIFLKANKPFHGRVVYKDADGNLAQLLPNPQRSEGFFNGGTVYELPGKGDRFDLEAPPLLGVEVATVYASTSPLGEIRTNANEGFYSVPSYLNEISTMTRGIKISNKEGDLSAPLVGAEFSEATAELTTSR